MVPMEGSGPTAKRKPESRPRSRGENGGLKYEILGTRRWKAPHPRFKEADLYSPTETVIQNPDLGVRGLEHEKASTGRWVGKKRTQYGKKRIYSQTQRKTEFRLETRRWKAAHPRFKETDLYSPAETVIQNPDLGVRRGAWNMRKLLKEAHRMGKEADLQPESRPPVSRGENGGLEYEILGTTRWEVAQGLKKRTYSRYSKTPISG